MQAHRPQPEGRIRIDSAMADYSVTTMPNHTAKTARNTGFTLIELSIVGAECAALNST